MRYLIVDTASGQQLLGVLAKSQRAAILFFRRNYRLEFHHRFITAVEK